MLRRFFILFVATGVSILVRPLLGLEIAAGTRLEISLVTPTSSRTSHSGDPVTGLVIAPVFVGGDLVVPQGSVISGMLERVDRVGLGLKHSTSVLGYRFDTLRVRDGAAVPIHTRVIEVETAKERVDSHGLVGGIYPTANFSSVVNFYVLPLLYAEPEFGVPILGIKVLIARCPDPEIYFPAGTEFILALTAPADISDPALQSDIAPIPPAQIEKIYRVLAQFPEHETKKVRKQASDLVNVLILGSRQSINQAFRAAGWAGAQPHSLRSLYRMYHCMVQRMGYPMAPMGNLRLNGAVADAEYQKSLNTFSKRHHVRLWKQSQEYVWFGAATEDTGYKLRAMHLTHTSDPLIDNERAKILNDLAYTGCVAAASLITRAASISNDQKQQ